MNRPLAADKSTEGASPLFSPLSKYANSLPMIVKQTISTLYAEPRPDARTDFAAALANAPQGCRVFFRADDIGIPGGKCRRMIELFRKYDTPLSLAVTPAWLGESRWKILMKWAGNEPLWCWHQHGWRHVNHQKSGKKGEFGADRPRADKRADLIKGREKLKRVMGDAFEPYFTPPWNRFDSETGELLAELGYKAVSRSAGAQRKVPLRDIPDHAVNVDLHTRNENTPEQGWAALLEELETAAETGLVGVMLHHQRMNGTAFDVLEALLAAVNGASHCRPTLMNQL